MNPSRARLRILLVDDDEDDYVVTRSFLVEIGNGDYDLEWVDCYERALEVIRDARHDVYLLDYRLGRQNGLELLLEAQKMGCRAPIILLTGQGDRELDVAVMKAGGSDYLIKGQFEAPLLERSIRYAIERRRAEENLRESEKRFRALVEKSSDSIVLLDAEGVMVYAGPSSRRVIGYDQKELADRSFLDLVHAEDVENVRQVLLRLAGRAGGTETLRYRLKQPNSGWLWVETVATNLLEEPGVRAIVTNTRDITERHQLELQLLQSQKMEAVGQLAAGVAHDFNNILTIIQGHANLVLAASLCTGEMADSLQEVSAAAERAANLTRQLLTFSRKQVMQSQPINLNQIIAQVSKMLTRTLSEDIKLELHQAADLPLVQGDSSMIEQIIINLALNARDAMTNGGKLSVATRFCEIEPAAAKAHADARVGPFVALRIQDSGCGMDSATLEHIFEPFFTTKEVGKGSGLGLATVYGIVQQHHGWIDVSSELGRGTSFEIFFPAADQAAVSAADQASPATVEGGRETILVVEDEPVLRELVREVLQRYGYRILDAGTGAESLEIWDKHAHEIDLLLTDMKMPEGISGPDLAKRLSRDRKDLKVIYTSGYSADSAGHDLVLREGINFLSKPYHPSTLAMAVRSCLDQPGQVLDPPDVSMGF